MNRKSQENEGIRLYPTVVGEWLGVYMMVGNTRVTQATMCGCRTA